MSIHEDRNSLARRGRRMSVDGAPPPPRYDVPFTSPLPGYPPPGFPSRSSPADFFLSRFPPPLMTFPPMNGFLPRPGDVPIFRLPASRRQSDDVTHETLSVDDKDVDGASDADELDKSS